MSKSKAKSKSKSKASGEGGEEQGGQVMEEQNDAVKAAEGIAAALAEVDPADNQALAVKVHAPLEKLRDGSGDSAVQNAANECISIIEKIIFQEISPADGKAKAGEALAALVRKCGGAGGGGGAADGVDEMHVVVEIVEDISAALVLVDPTDNQALAVDLHSKLEKLRGATDNVGVQTSAADCIALVEKIIFQEIKPDEGIAKIAENLTALRRKLQYVEGVEGVSDIEGVALPAGVGDGTLAKDLDFDMDAEEEAPKPTSPPLKQDADGFFVDPVAKAKPAVKFKREIDISTLDASLLSEFIAEAQEHFANADSALLRLEASPADVDIINELFRVFHTIKGVAGFLALDAIQALAHATESLMDKAREKVFVLNSAAIDLIFSTVDTLKKEVESITAALENNTVYVVQEIMDQIIASVNAMHDGLLSNKPMPKLGEILIHEGKVSPWEVDSVLHEQERRPGTKMGEILVERGVLSPTDVTNALEKQGAPVAKGGAVIVKESVKVDTEKLDKLVDMIGELVITESMVTGELEGMDFQSTRLGVNARQLKKITRQLQEIGLSMRMMSLKATFNKMARLVRDLARKAGKEIGFVSEGEDTELDKSVIEHIADPLVHMIRNSADHGLEHPDEREAAGKPRTGTITLRAYQKGGSICIEIQDDGRGLNRDAILKKAIEKGILEPDAQVSDAEINALIFAPGFSTAAQVTDISGRGVGMDVVKKNVEALRGRIEINTKIGEGTTFIIHLPLTLAIMDGMVVWAGDERFILPTFSVVENFKPALKDLTDVMGTQKMVMCHGQLLPLYSLAEVMGKRNTISVEDGIVMVVEDAGKRTGLLVDRIIGQQQTVIKKLGDGVGKIDGVSGGAIMPDGKVSLIIDIAETVKLAMRSGSTIVDPKAEVEHKAAEE